MQNCAIDIHECPLKSDELTIENDYSTYARKIETGQSRPGSYLGVDQKVHGLLGREFISSSYSVIVGVRVVLKRTVVSD